MRINSGNNANKNMETKGKVQHVIDGADQVLGRLATQIAHILQGKDTAGYLPRLPGDSTVIVKNASKIRVTGRKESEKLYHRHTGYQGHLFTKTYRQVVAADPREALRKAVFNMLPKNFIRQKRMNRLKIEP